MTRPTRIPSDVNRPDRILGPFTVRQVTILAAAAGGLHLAWLALRPWLAAPVFLLVATPLAAHGRAEGSTTTPSGTSTDAARPSSSRDSSAIRIRGSGRRAELGEHLGGHVGGPAGDRGERGHACHDRGRAQCEHHRDRVNPALVPAIV